MYGGTTESFGKQWGPGDVVGVFLDLVDHTISKNTLQSGYRLSSVLANSYSNHHRHQTPTLLSVPLIDSFSEIIINLDASEQLNSLIPTTHRVI